MSAAGQPATFDLRGPLPDGVMVVEASAGTGKTYTIAALAARYVAEGRALGELLVVTFTNLATGELRIRVRDRLAGARDAIEAVLAGEAPPDHDEVVALLVEGSEDELRLRHARLVQALADYDAATITTIHGFCQEVLKSLGVAGDIDRAFTFTEDAGDIAEEVVDDLYVRLFGGTRPPRFSRAQARDVAVEAIQNPTTRLLPDDAPAGSDAHMRFRIACAAREEADRRRRAQGVMTYDDVLTRLRAMLADPAVGAAVAERLRRTFRVALIDEFQDTDPDQWEILSRAFADSPTALVLIGDPKQAVYAFRGADVYAYLRARRGRPDRTLDTNRRSDQGLLEAYDALFGTARLGHPEIEYRRVHAPPAHREPRLAGAPDPAPLRIRLVPRTTAGIALSPQARMVTAASARAHIARDLAADVVALLRSGAELEERRADGTPLRRAVVDAGDVAVLVRTNAQARAVKEALEGAGVPAVVNGAGSVFATAAARDWRRLLEALARPASLRRARAVALTPFVGWTAEEIAGASDADWNRLQARLHVWAGVLGRSGVATLLELIGAQTGLSERVLAATGGERELTDLRHVGELLHAEGEPGVTALLGWLRRRCAAHERDPGDDDRARRLESDAKAVQVLTIHSSKGLEFPFVYCPYLWDPGWISPELRPVTFHDPDREDERTIDVALDLEVPGYEENVAQDRREQRAEELRLAYVALTRARHQAVVWWAATSSAMTSALGRLVFDRDAAEPVEDERRPPPADADARRRFEEIAGEAPGRISVADAVIPADAVWRAPRAAAARLEAASLDRTLDASWRRTSYSAIVAGAYEAQVASEREEAVGADDLPPARPLAGERPDGADERASWHATPSLLDDLPAGARTGTFVHRVLERIDFAAEDLDAELATEVAEQQARRRLDLGEHAALVRGLRAAIETPLGPLAGDRRLRDVARADRLDELAFELPLVGGDTPAGELTLDAVAAVLRRRVPAGDPLDGYADQLADPVLRSRLRGYLAGTIDVVVRSPGGGPFAIVDYKTNRLAPPGEPLTAWHHRPEALAAAMRRHHYALQALLYAVALHRYLRWRLPGAAVADEPPTVLYLFLRGMTGPATPATGGTPAGVFSWQPPAGLVPALSDLFDAGGPA